MENCEVEPEEKWGERIEEGGFNKNLSGIRIFSDGFLFEVWIEFWVGWEISFLVGLLLLEIFNWL